MSTDFPLMPSEDMSTSLAGRHIIVTGAGQGIGLAVARMVVERGGSVTLVDLNPDSVRAAVESLGGEKAQAVIADVSDPQAAQTAVEQAEKNFGAIHGLVNNAGVIRAAMIEKMELADWQTVIDVHLTGSFLFLQAVGRHMLARARQGEKAPGAIVNISSDAGRRGTVGQINYGAAKAGLLGVTMSAAREWARYGIRVNTVCFGVVETPMTEVIRSDKFKETYLAQIPLGRWAPAEEVAQPVCFLLSDQASYITGQHLSVNGGYVINV